MIFCFLQNIYALFIFYRQYIWYIIVEFNINIVSLLNCWVFSNKKLRNKVNNWTARTTALSFSTPPLIDVAVAVRGAMVALATRTTSQPELPAVLATVGRFVRYRMWWWFPSSLWWLWFKPFFLSAVSVLFAQTRRRRVVASLFQIFAVVASLASPEFSCGGFVLIEGWIWICSLMFWIVDVFF